MHIESRECKVQVSRISCVLAVALGCCLSASAQVQTGNDPQPATPSELLAEAESHREAGRWNDAMDAYEAVLDHHAADAESAAAAQVQLGHLLIEREAFAQAEAVLSGVTSSFPNNREAVFLADLYRADLLRVQERHDEAEAWLRQILSDTTLTAEEHVWATVKLVETQNWRVDRDLLIDDLEQLVSADPDPDYAEPHNWARIRLAELLIHDRQWAKAEAICRAVVNDHEAGRSTDAQAAFALLWEARGLLWRERSLEAQEKALMALALAETADQNIAYEAELVVAQAHAQKAFRTQDTPAMDQALAFYQSAVMRASDKDLLGNRRDNARLKLGEFLEKRDLLDKAVAWMRMGIENPSNMTKTDQLLAEGISRCLPTDEADAWHWYLLAPSSQADPTRAYTVNEFGNEPPSASLTELNNVWVRHHWLGEYYLRNGRFHDAIDQFKATLHTAGSELERAETMKALALSSRQAMNRATTRKYTARASALWQSIARSEVSQGTAHHAIDQAVTVWEANGYPDNAIHLLEQLISEFDPQTHSSRSLFARIRLVREYMEYKQPEKAQTLAEESLALHLDIPFPNHHRDLCSMLAGLLNRLYKNQGNQAAVNATLGELQLRWPELFADTPGK